MNKASKNLETSISFTPTELNRRSMELCRSVINDSSLAARLAIETIDDLQPANVLDFGTDRAGTLSGGVLLARICLADLADVAIAPADMELGLPRVQVRTDHPLAACIGAQYAGWPFSVGKYYAMCSGPARMARGHEELLTEYGLVGKSENVVGILETSQRPDAEALDEFSSECHLERSQVYLCLARTASLPGAVQIVARSIETTLHKLHEIGFDLQFVKNAVGDAPLPPIAADDLTALGWTNDAILFGAQVTLWIDCDDKLIEQLGPKIPSSSSSDFGRPFLDVFNDYERDFYKVDKLLFSPAKVLIHNLATGRSFFFGDVRNDLLRTSYGLD